MTVEDLGNKCKENKIDCDKCQYVKECERLEELLDGVSPYSLLTILQAEIVV